MLGTDHSNPLYIHLPGCIDDTEIYREREREGGSMAESEKPHAVCIPFPAQGHINPMFKLANLLHHEGFHITFVNTEFNHRRLLNSRGLHSLSNLSPDFRFETIPDSLPHSDVDATQDIRSLCESVRKNFLAPFRDLLAILNDTTTSKVPPVTCIISDIVMSCFTLTVAQELGIPVVIFPTASVCGFMGGVHFPHLIQRGLTPLKDSSSLTNGYLETPIDWIPGMSGIRLRDLPTFIRTTDPNDFMVDFVIEMVEEAHKGSAIILNTFDALDSEILEALSPMFPPIYTIGPLHLLHNRVSDDDLIKSIGSNLWKEDPVCLQWLDSKEPNSVLYVNFGSVTVITPQQLTEFSWGLANSKQSFLWIIRPDLVAGESAVLPPEFLKETEERGALSSWCPQEQVLGHPAIGGFLTHCGWNSTLESICSGVPMICWPFFADQQTNCRYACTKWGVGMEIDNNVKREEVEKLVRELMEGDQEGTRDMMRKKAMEWKRRAEEAINGADGSSYRNLHKLVKEVLLSKKKI